MTREKSLLSAPRNTLFNWQENVDSRASCYVEDCVPTLLWEVRAHLPDLKRVTASSFIRRRFAILHVGLHGYMPPQLDHFFCNRGSYKFLHFYATISFHMYPKLLRRPAFPHEEVESRCRARLTNWNCHPTSVYALKRLGPEKGQALAKPYVVIIASDWPEARQASQGCRLSHLAAAQWQRIRTAMPA